MGRVIRRLLVRFVRFFILRPVALVGLLLVVALVAVAGIVLPSLNGQGTPGAGGLPIALSLPHNNSEPQATSDFLHGNQTYNAQLMWNSLSTDAQQRLSQDGGSPQTLQQQMNAAKQQGVRLQDISYIGGKKLDDGTSVQFYLVSLQPGANADVQYVPYMFTVGPDGKIDKVQ